MSTGSIAPGGAAITKLVLAATNHGKAETHHGQGVSMYRLGRHDEALDASEKGEELHYATAAKPQGRA